MSGTNNNERMIFKMAKYIVYMHISPSNKRYIGITCQKPENRWRAGKGYKGNQYFFRAIEKYGWDNFEHIILFDSLTEHEAKEFEQHFIQYYDTTNPQYGYNITLGGEGGNGWCPSEETKKKISDALKGKNNPNYQKTFSEETKQKMSKAKKGIPLTKEHNENIRKAQSGTNHPMHGKHHSEESKQKMSKNHANVDGKNNPNAKKILCLETNEIFNTQKEAYQSVNGTNAGIIYAMKNNKKYKGYTFKYYDEKEVS